MLIPERSARVLAIGAHPDDIELGAGGFIHRLTARCQATVHFLILTEGLQGLEQQGPAAAANRRREAQKAAGLLGVGPDRTDQGLDRVEVLDYPDCKLHEHGHDLIREIEQRLDRDVAHGKYDVVLSHAGEDTHADHRTVFESTLSAVRYFHGTVLLYQSPSIKPNGFHPTFFARLEEDDIEQKDLSIQAHVSQRGRAYTSVSRTRGMADNWAIFHRQPKGTYLEAFEVYKSFY